MIFSVTLSDDAHCSGHTGNVTCVAITEEEDTGGPEMVATGSADKSVRVWDIREAEDNLHRNKFVFSGHSRKVSFDISIQVCTEICKYAHSRGENSNFQDLESTKNTKDTKQN